MSGASGFRSSLRSHVKGPMIRSLSSANMSVAASEFSRKSEFMGRMKTSVFAHGGAVFPEKTELRTKLRRQMTTKEFVRYKSGGWIQKLARHPIFEQGTLSVIALNAVWLWIDADYNTPEASDAASTFFQFMEQFFCFFFVFEIIVRFLSFQHKVSCFRDAWFVFDTALVCLQIVDTWIIGLIMHIDPSSTGGSPGVGLLRLVRLVRLSRLIRLAKLLTSMPELMILVKGLGASLRSVFFTLVLLFLVLYTFGILTRQLARDSDVGNTYFPSVPMAMYVLLFRGCFLDNPTSVMDDLHNFNGWFSLLFLIFILLAPLTILNMLIGVLCEAVVCVADSEREEIAIRMVKHKLLHILNENDRDGDGVISRKEFAVLLDSEEAIEALNDVGVDPVGLADAIDHIFENGNNFFAFEDVMEQVLLLRRSNHSTVKDMMTMRRYLGQQFEDLNQSLKVLTRRIQALEGEKRHGYRNMTRVGSDLPFYGSSSSEESLDEVKAVTSMTSVTSVTSTTTVQEIQPKVSRRNSRLSSGGRKSLLRGAGNSAAEWRRRAEFHQKLHSGRPDKQAGSEVVIKSETDRGFQKGLKADVHQDIDGELQKGLKDDS